MDRRAFLQTATGLAVGATLPDVKIHAADRGPGFASPAEAAKGPREKLLFVACVSTGPGKARPDYLAVVDADPDSKRHGQVVHRLPMPEVGDELHHFGWNICSSCHGKPGDRRYLILPGLKSGRIHIVDAADPLDLKIVRVFSPEKVRKATGLSAPHTVHCLPDESVVVSMLGDENGEAPGGFLRLDSTLEKMERWTPTPEGMKYNYDFWYQPRHNVMVSSEWAAPKTFNKGFDPADVKAGKYGQRLHIWDWKEKTIRQTLDLGDQGLIPLEVRFLHDPDSTHGFVGAALSSTLWHFYRTKEGTWKADNVAQVAPVEVKGVPFPVPGLITDLLISLDDRWLYLANWLQGDVRQYDISDPARPRLAGQLFLGGLPGNGVELGGKKRAGGAQMLQLSLDGKRLYVTSSLFSSWDDQFYPAIAREGTWLVRVNCDTAKGGLALDEKFFVDFGAEPAGPARAHEVRYPGGDCTSDIFS